MEEEKCEKNPDSIKGECQTKTKSVLNYSEILKHIGQFGRWQQQIFLWACIISLGNGIVTVVFAFTAYVPKYRCSVPFCESPTNWTYYDDTNGTSFPDFVISGIPESVLKTGGDCRYFGMTDLTADPISSPESCQFYLSEMSRNASDIKLMECTSEHLIFDSTVVLNSIITEYDLTCSKTHVKSIIGSAYMVGVLVGSFFVGLFADRFGRKAAFLAGTVATALTGVIGAFVTTPEGFAFFRFLTGFSVKGLFMIAFIISVEMVGPKFAALIGVAINIPFAFGELILGLEAYFIRDWKTLQIVAHAPVILLLVLGFVLPESPRWLIAVGRVKEAQDILVTGAKTNKQTIPQHLLDPSSESKEEKVKKSATDWKKIILEFNYRSLFKKEKVHNDCMGGNSLMHLFRPRQMMFRTVNLFFQWFSVVFVYYGLSFGATSLSGDPYSNFCLSVVVEIPGYLFAMAVMDCWGRKPILVFCQLLSGFGCIFAGLLVDNDAMTSIQVFMSLIGKFGVSAGFSIVYLYSAELYPTYIRSTSVGTCSLVGRFGAILAFLVELGNRVWKPFPMVIMGTVSIFAGMLAFLLPESTGHPLPETLDEALNVGKKTERGICTCVCPTAFNQFLHQ